MALIRGRNSSGTSFSFLPHLEVIKRNSNGQCWMFLIILWLTVSIDFLVFFIFLLKKTCQQFFIIHTLLYIFIILTSHKTSKKIIYYCIRIGVLVLLIFIDISELVYSNLVPSLLCPGKILELHAELLNKTVTW